MVFGGLLDAGVAVLILIALAQYAKVRDKAEKGYNWLAAAGVTLLFSGLFSSASVIGTFIGAGIWNGLASLFQVVGWILALVGTIFVLYETVLEK